jgi:hypothetical protein
MVLTGWPISHTLLFLDSEQCVKIKMTAFKYKVMNLHQDPNIALMHDLLFTLDNIKDKLDRIAVALENLNHTK